MSSAPTFVLAALGSRNGNDVITLCQHPGKGKLSWRAAFSGSKSPDPLNQFYIPTEILPLETRHATPPIIVGKIFHTHDFCGQKTATERAVGDKSDAKHAHRAEPRAL